MTTPTKIYKFRNHSDRKVRSMALYLYPELDMSWCIDDVHEYPIEDQFRYYVSLMKKRGTFNDEVPISWNVAGDCFFEAVPYKLEGSTKPPAGGDFHTHFSEEDQIDWFTMPISTKHREFLHVLWEWIGFLPGPFQKTFPLETFTYIRSRGLL